MTRGTLRFVLGVLAALTVAGVAGGQPASDVSDRIHPRADLAGETYIGPHMGYSFIGEKDRFCRCTVDSNDFLFLGGRLGHFFTGQLAVELTSQYLRPSRNPSYWESTLGALWDFTPSIPGWNTYVGAGGGASRRQPFNGKPVGLAYLAFGSEYRFNKLVGMRLEMKGQYNFSHDETVVIAGNTFSDHHGGAADIQPSIGVLFHFGGKPAPVYVEPAPAPPPPPPPAPAPPPPAAPAPAPAPPVVTPPPPPAPTTDTIDFDRGKSRVTNIAKAKLDAIALRLRDNPRATCEITGYPDARGGAAGETLARQRAENAKQYLIDRHGIDASRITTRTDMTDTSHRGQDVIVVTFR
ncbi:MAG TPA: OmpA family protein [Thermoanaerobaculia bacterium]|nr:OmpA family protein [Thermoanaerobaculia bacterium]